MGRPRSGVTDTALVGRSATKVTLMQHGSSQPQLGMSVTGCWNSEPAEQRRGLHTLAVCAGRALHMLPGPVLSGPHSCTHAGWVLAPVYLLAESVY